MRLVLELEKYSYNPSRALNRLRITFSSSEVEERGKTVLLIPETRASFSHNSDHCPSEESHFNANRE